MKFVELGGEFFGDPAGVDEHQRGLVGHDSGVEVLFDVRPDRGGGIRSHGNIQGRGAQSRGRTQNNGGIRYHAGVWPHDRIRCFRTTQHFRTTQRLRIVGSIISNEWAG